MHSMKVGGFGALALLLLLSGTAWTETFTIPGCTGSYCTVDYNPNGNFTVPILKDCKVTNKTVNQPFSVILCNGFGDVYYLNLLRETESYQAYRGYCSYHALHHVTGWPATVGEVVLLRMKATPTMPEHFSHMSTQVRWNNNLYILNAVFRPFTSSVMVGYENWFPFDMSYSFAIYVVQGSFKAW